MEPCVPIDQNIRAISKSVVIAENQPSLVQMRCRMKFNYSSPSDICCWSCSEFKHVGPGSQKSSAWLKRPQTAKKNNTMSISSGDSSTTATLALMPRKLSCQCQKIAAITGDRREP